MESRLGVGSTFKVAVATGDVQNVPFLKPEEVAKAEPANAGIEKSAWQFPESRVLIVDDGAENRELLKLLLDDVGLMVDEAENGLVGMKKALAEHYDVILMDVNMPVMDGFSAAKKLRQAGLETSIIALTANAMAGAEQECLDAGYSGYLSKPIDLDRFMTMMADLLGGQNLADSADPAPELDAGSSALHELVSALPIDTTPIHSTLPAGNEKYRQLIIQFVTRLEERLKTVQQAFSKRDFASVADFAHWLKGAGGSIGFNAFTEPASKLENLARTGDNTEDIGQVIDNLRSVANRLVIPDSGPTDRSATTSAMLNGASTEMAESPARTFPTPVGPVTSRLGSIPQFQKVIVKFIKKLKNELDRADSALQNGRKQELTLFAHWLKGAAGTVGFDEFTEPAARLEGLVKTGQMEDAGQVLVRLQHLAEAIVPPVDLSSFEHFNTPAPEPHIVKKI